MSGSVWNPVGWINTAFADFISYLQRGVGAIVRTVQDKLTDTVSAAEFGAKGDGVTDDSAALQLCINTGRVIDLCGLTYLVSTKLLFNVAGTVFKNGTLKWNGTNGVSKLADISAANVTFKFVIFDGNNKQPAGSLLYVASNTVRPRFHNCTFQNLLGTLGLSDQLNNMYGLLISPYGVTNFEVLNCIFKDFEKRNDGTGFAATVGAGFTGGIFFLTDDFAAPTAPQPIPTSGIIENCVVSNVQTKLAAALPSNLRLDYDDADGIRFYGDPAGARYLYVNINNLYCTKVSKRAVKVSICRGVNLDNITCDARGLPYFPVTAVKLESGTTARNIRCISDGPTAPYYAAVEINGGEHVTLDGLEVEDCTYAIQLDVVNSTVLKNVFIRNVRASGIVQGGLYQVFEAGIGAHDQLVVESSLFSCSGNTAFALYVPGASGGQGGFIGRNLTVINGEINIQGYGNELDGLKMSITNSAYAGYTTAGAVFRFGGGLGTAQQSSIKNADLDFSGINTAYLSATRQYLTLFFSDRLKISNLSITVPEGLTVAYPHAEFVGNDLTVNGLVYNGPGTLNAGTFAATLRWQINSAVRTGNGACTVPFFKVNAASQYYSFLNITDFRPTTATSITSAVATNGIAGNIQTRSSNATPAVSGVAKTFNLNTF